MNTISNTDDVIDSRDVIARIEELESEREDAEADDNEKTWDVNNGEELAALKALAEQAEGYVEDWRHGVALIRYSYFETYARELADDIGAVHQNASWPNTCIDWEQAARELQQDYTAVDFDGVTYWVH